MVFPLTLSKYSSCYAYRWIALHGVCECPLHPFLGHLVHRFNRCVLKNDALRLGNGAKIEVHKEPEDNHPENQNEREDWPQEG